MDKIKCCVCGSEFKQITVKHLKSHNLTLSGYKELYPNAPTRSPASIKLRKQLAKSNKICQSGHIITQETRDKISQKNKGNIAHNKGVPMSDKQKAQLSSYRKKYYQEHGHWNTGNDTPFETREKISQTLCDANLTFSDESKHKRNLTIEQKKLNGWIHHSTLAFTEKLKQSAINNAHDKFNDKEWLYEQHITNKVTIAGIAVKLGLHWRRNAGSVTSQLRRFNIPIHRYSNNISVHQQEIEEFLDELGVNYTTNIRNIIHHYNTKLKRNVGLELDIHIPDHNIAIEYNGVYWHSEIYKNANYHLKKTELCEDKELRLIHIFSDEWEFQQQKCKDTIRHLVNKSERGVYARKTTIREIPWKQAKDFLNEYHLLNAGTAGNKRIGAFDKEDNLIGVMVFGMKNNEGNDNTTELKRFVTNKKNNPGLGSKMFKWAVTEFNYTEVIAFVDRRWFTGLVKQYIGFELVGVTEPSLWWTDGTHRYHRRFITKTKAQQILMEAKIPFDDDLSKPLLMLKLGYYRIYDSGKLKLKWKQNP